MSKEEHNKIAKIENLIWEIAQTLHPHLLIQKEKIEKVLFSNPNLFFKQSKNYNPIE